MEAYDFTNEGGRLIGPSRDAGSIEEVDMITLDSLNLENVSAHQGRR